MAWTIGTCDLCNYHRPRGAPGAIYYCVFWRRQHYFDWLRFKRKRRWIRVCDDCVSQTERQRYRNLYKRPPEP